MKSERRTSRYDHDHRKGNQQKNKLERELVQKLPDETQPAEEWGERLATGKAIATGGKSTAKAMPRKGRARKGK